MIAGESAECTLCHEIKPVSEFYKGRVDCKACKRAMSKRNYQRDPASRIAQTKAYQRDHLAHVLELRRERVRRQRKEWGYRKSRRWPLADIPGNAE